MMEFMTRFFKDIYNSCIDFQSYKKIASQKVSRSVQYFILLLFIISIVSSIFYSVFFKIGLDKFNEWSQKHLPEINIQNGEVSSEVSQPYTAIEKDFVFILDTTGEVTRIDSRYPSGVLVNKNSLLLKRMGMEDQVVDLSWIQSLELSAPIIAQWREKMMPLVIPFIFVATLLGLLISKFFHAFLFSYGASVFFPKERTGLGLKELFNLSLYSATPAILISLLAQILQLQIPLFWWIYFGMYAAFFIGAFSNTRVINEQENKKDNDLQL